VSALWLGSSAQHFDLVGAVDEEDESWGRWQEKWWDESGSGTRVNEIVSVFKLLAPNIKS
jgi:hypothetical protein